MGLVPLFKGVSGPLSTMCGHNGKLAARKLEEGPHQNPILLAPELEFPTSTIVGNKRLFFRSQLVYGTLSQLPRWPRRVTAWSRRQGLPTQDSSYSHLEISRGLESGSFPQNGCEILDPPASQVEESCGENQMFHF